VWRAADLGVETSTWSGHRSVLNRGSREGEPRPGPSGTGAGDPYCKGIPQPQPPIHAYKSESSALVWAAKDNEGRKRLLYGGPGTMSPLHPRPTNTSMHASRFALEDGI